MVNEVRGEVALELGGRQYCLCLTMGALAEIENGLNASSLDELDSRLSVVSASDLVMIIHALLKGGGETLTREETSNLPLDIAAMTTAVGQAFRAAGVGGAEPS